MNVGRNDLQALWDRVEPATQTFDPAALATLPQAARAYLSHAIARGAPLATAVRLRMHGRIRIGRWHAFTAEQVIVGARATVWCASVRVFGLPLRGYDRLVDGEGAMRWRLLGIVPLIRASGPDITRSAAGRVAGESIWLPTALAGGNVAWHDGSGGVACARLDVAGHATELALALDNGRLRTVSFARWGNPGGGAFREARFRALVDEEATFGGCTIPVRLRAGWHFDDPDRFEARGKFFDVEIDDAVYR